jgi:hypothetical protein
MAEATVAGRRGRLLGCCGNGRSWPPVNPSASRSHRAKSAPLPILQVIPNAAVAASIIRRNCTAIDALAHPAAISAGEPPRAAEPSTRASTQRIDPGWRHDGAGERQGLDRTGPITGQRQHGRRRAAGPSTGPRHRAPPRAARCRRRAAPQSMPLAASKRSMPPESRACRSLQ